MDKFELALTTKEDGCEYKYYINEEETDDNANTKLYSDGELLSDNYFANNELMITLEKIYKGRITKFTMSENMKYNYHCMIKEGSFED